MNKFIQENKTLLLLVLLILVVVLILVFKKKEEPKKDDYDLSKVKIVTLDEVISLYDDVEPHVYIVARNTCSACQTFMPAVNEVIDKHHITVYYINLLDIDYDTPQYAIFKTLLNYNYEYQDKKGTMDNFMGYTPMILISSNHDTIYGSLGSMTADAFEVILKEYGIIKGEGE